jgi:adenine-specific DNA-methyltransferase
MIYIDPPYGIKFGSNWQVSTRKRDIKDGKAEDATRQPEQIKAFRDTWELGIHSYLGYLRDRFAVARELLTETGSLFVQISEENLHHVRELMDEVFGDSNFVVQIVFTKKGSQTGALLKSINEYVVWYAKDAQTVKFRNLYVDREFGGPGGTGFTTVETADGSRRPAFPHEQEDASTLSPGTRLCRLDPLFSWKSGPNDPIQFRSKLFQSGGNSWKVSYEGIKRGLDCGRIVPRGERLYHKRYWDDLPVVALSNLWGDLAGAAEMVYVVQTNPKVVQRCLLMATDPGDLVLDPTCGSGTTAYVAEQWGRRWITIDTSRVALALARTRLMSAKYPFYLLSDSQDGIEKEAELNATVPALGVNTQGDVRKGFVYRRVPHITLKSIANNPDIKEGMTREEINAAIAKHAETEILYDQPYADNKRVRVSGPFTVESLSPHRVLTPDYERPASERAASSIGPAQFELMILDNLKKAGVQNTVKNERLRFDRLEPYAGTWLHAEGEYTENSESKRVAVCIGPEHGTVGPDLVNDAAKEAVKGIGFNLLVVCGFAFDPHVSEEAKQYGNLTVLTARMNPDLSMGDGFLKKTGAGNLFMVFGEPDISITKDSGGKVIVEVEGLDVYDPTTGQIRSHSTDDIACWFIDTDYNEESFFVRHAYFCGADEPYEKLKRALRAEIDESVWSTLYSTQSRPFDRPSKGKIAVKVINHYGDEVLKVYDL